MRSIFLIILFLPSLLFSQRNVKDSIIGTPLIGVHYGANWTGGDLADRYGFFNHIGGMVGYKTNKNWYWCLDGNFMFGNDIKIPNLLAGIMDSNGIINDINGGVGKVFLFSRGFNVNVGFGKLFPVLSPNKNSGILVQAGAGFLYHKIRIETNEQVIPQIETNYTYGYDRLTTGFNFHQFIGYSFMSNTGFYNFYGGFYFQQGLTKNYRTIFFDQPDVPVSTATRLDLQFGLRIGWYIPFYKRLPKDYYFD